MDSLFPTLPKDIGKLSDKEVEDLYSEYETAEGLLHLPESDPASQEFLGDRTADDIIAQYEAAAEEMKTLKVEIQSRVDAADAYEDKKAAIKAEVHGEAEEAEEETEAAEEEAATDEEEETETEEAAPEAGAVEEDASAEEEEAPVSDPVAEKVLVTASAEEAKPRLRRAVPTPAPDRVVVNEPEKKELSLVASALLPGTPPGSKIETREQAAQAVIDMCKSIGAPSHRADGREEKFTVAKLDYSVNFPPERTLHKTDWVANGENIAAIGSPYFNDKGREALVASGGLCAPLTPIYTMPQLATDARPVWDSLPVFRAERGGVNVPTPTIISDADGAITTITEAEDALGGTYALKSCLDMDCPDYTETAVTIISACREFGNLNAMAWPEKIAHELEITRALHSRTAEGYILDQIKGLSVNVTASDTGSTLASLVQNIATQAFEIRSLLRMPRETRFQVLLPAVALDILLTDVTWFAWKDRYQTRGDVDAFLAGIGIDATYYLDTVSSGTAQIQASDQSSGALDGFPADIQYALFPQGTFLGVDMAELNLGIVRDSTLNSTNDFQIFWETFQNVARIGPAQAAQWMTFTTCPNGSLADNAATPCGA